MFPPGTRAEETSPPKAGEDIVLASRDATLWRPVGASGPSPLVVFSHGYGGCPGQSTFLTYALAEAGYLVIAPRHADAGCGVARTRRSEAPFLIPSVWTDASGRDRREDIVAILEALKQDPAFRDGIDWPKLALMGHSLGGYTVLGLAGAWPSWRIPGIAAVVALSPTCAPFLGKGGRLDAMTAPVSFQSGTMDYGILPALIQRDGCFDQARGPAQLVLFRRAGHFAWTDLASRAHPAIVAATRGFLDAHLLGLDKEKLGQRHRGMVEVRVKSGDTDTVRTERGSDP